MGMVPVGDVVVLVGIMAVTAGLVGNVMVKVVGIPVAKTGGATKSRRLKRHQLARRWRVKIQQSEHKELGNRLQGECERENMVPLEISTRSPSVLRLVKMRKERMLQRNLVMRKDVMRM